MRALLSIPASFLLAISAASAADTRRMPMDGWVDAVQMTLQTQCTQYSAAQKMAATRKDEETSRLAAISVGFACECMPQGIAGYRRALPDSDRTRVVSYDEFRASFSPVMNKCAAAQTRSELSTLCAHDKSFSEGAAGRRAYCECFSSRLQAMDDDTLASAAEAAYAGLQARSKAIKESRPAPASSSKRSFLDEIGESCRAAAR